VVEDVAAAQSLAQHRQVQPSGRLRVTMPNDMGNLVLAPMLAEFVLKYPAVTLEVDLSSRFVDLIAENFDVAVRMGELRDDATLAARRIAAFRRSPKRSSSTTRCGSWCAPAIRRYGRSSGVRPAGKAFRRVTRRPIHRSC
jgi:DNA-binding transcriptional LysR family regulator